MRIKKIISVILMFGLCSCIISGCNWEAHNSHQTEVGSLQLVEYHPEEDIQKAIKMLKETDEKCELITAADVSQRKVSLVFLGLAYSSQMEQICTMLKEYNIPAVFLIDGMSAAEDSDTVKMFAREGFEIGNYTLRADRYMNEQTEEEIATSFAHAQTILKEIIGKEPKYCAANATEFDHHVLHAAYSAGLKTAVKPSSYIADISFPTFNAAMGYMTGIKSGEIIAIKLNDTLDEIEYEPFEQDERPATDFDDSLKETEQEEEKNTDIVVTVQYLLDALETTQTAVVPLERLNLKFDKLVEKMFRESEDAIQYELPEHKAVDASWFNHSLFIGDSLTLSMSLYPVGFPDTTAFCAYKSITPKQFVDNVSVSNDDGSKTAVFDDICKQNPNQIFILLGTNALASGTNANLVTSYELLIQKLQKQFPDVPIYIQGLPPVTEATSAERVTLTIGRLKKVNVQLAEMANKNGCYYIDLTHALANEEGFLSTYIAQEDGIHLNQEGCKKWFNYLKTHVLVEEHE